jgi:Caudovirus prohead serine protease
MTSSSSSATTPSGLSIGFVPLTDRWSADRTRVTRVRADLVEVSVTAFPAYPDATIAALRSDKPTPVRPRLRAAYLARAAACSDAFGADDPPPAHAKPYPTEHIGWLDR